MDLNHVMKVVTTTINFIRSRGLNHRLFQNFLNEIESEFGDVIYHNQVHWLTRAKVLKRFYNLKEEIGIFMIEKESPVTELKDENWL